MKFLEHLIRVFKSIKCRLYPTNEQIQLLDMQFGACRYIYNWALDYSRWEYQENKTTTFRKDWQALIPKLKEYLPWLAENGNAQSLQSELAHLESAFKRFYKKKAGFPKFKSKHGKQSLSVPQQFKLNLETNRLSITKLKDIKIVLSKDISGMNLRSVTITKTCTGKYFASILYETGQEAPTAPIPVKRRSLGIDLGLKDFAILSTGTKVSNPKFLERDQKRLRRLSQAFSRKKKDSKNRSKAKLKLALLHETISNRRSNFLHNLTHDLTCENKGAKTLCVETLNVKGMMKNHCLARSISSVSWGEFIRQLDYKCRWSGMNLLSCGKFDPTSKTCSHCKAKNDSLKLSDRAWMCSACGCQHDRDINAAKNIVDFAFSNLHGRGEASEVLYPELAGEIKPVEMKALVVAKAATKLLSVKQEVCLSL